MLAKTQHDIKFRQKLLVRNKYWSEKWRPRKKKTEGVLSLKVKLPWFFYPPFPKKNRLDTRRPGTWPCNFHAERVVFLGGAHLLPKKPQCFFASKLELPSQTLFLEPVVFFCRLLIASKFPAAEKKQKKKNYKKAILKKTFCLQKLRSISRFTVSCFMREKTIISHFLRILCE